MQRHPAPAAGSLLPALDLGRHDSAALAEAGLTRSLAQIRRYYPAATNSPARPLLVVHDGVLRRGWATAVAFADDAAPPQPVRMEVAVLCCAAGHELVEYRFRHAASFPAEREMSAFLRAFPWTAEEADR